MFVQVIKYGLIYILSIVVFAALIAIREYTSIIMQTSQLTVDSSTALAFRQVLHFNCTICQNI